VVGNVNDQLDHHQLMICHTGIIVIIIGCHWLTNDD